MRRVGVVGVVVACMVAASLVGIASAPAQTTGDGVLGPDYVRATASDLGAGTFSGPGLPAVAPATESPFTWDRTTTGARCVVFAGPIPSDLADAVLPLPGIEPIPGSPVQVGTMQGAAPGALWLEPGAPLPAKVVWTASFAVDTGTPRAGGSGLVVVPRCVGPDAPALPPEPPSAATIWEQTPLPRALVQSSPPGTPNWPGVVNLESRFWSGAVAEARASVTLDGYVVDVVARPVAYAWSFGNGLTTVDGLPSTSGAPARVTFRRRGDHQVALHVVWVGTAHIAAPAFGLDLGVHDLGTVTLGEGVVHHVAEIRALLRSRSASRVSGARLLPHQQAAPE